VNEDEFDSGKRTLPPPVSDDDRPQLRTTDELMAVLREVADGITMQDSQGRIIFANDAAARTVGLDTADDYYRLPVTEILQRFEVFDSQGLPLSLDRLPGRRAMRGERGDEITVRFRVVATGEERWSIVGASPVFDDRGGVRFAVNIFCDVTDRMHAELAREFLSNASVELASSLDYETTLENVARLAVPIFADICIFDILADSGVVRCAVVHRDPERAQALRDLIERVPLDLTSKHPVARVLRTGQSELATNIARGGLNLASLEPERATTLRELGFLSTIVTPLVARGHPIGALSFIHAESGRQYTTADLDLAEEVARRAALAVDNATLYRDAQVAAARLSALAEASRAFAEASLDLQTVLDTVVQTVVGLIGDQCTLRLISDDGEWADAVAMYHRDPVLLVRLRELMLSERQHVTEGLIGTVLATGTPFRTESVTAGFMDAVKPEHRAFFERVPLYGMLVVPLRVRERVIGTLGVASEQPETTISQDDETFVQELADRAALAIENARLHREAQDAVRAREQFLSIASHELKTPLTSVKASAQLLDRRLRGAAVDPTRVMPLVNSLQAEIGRLETLVTDLLDATRIQQGRLELRRELVDLSELALLAIERFEHAPQRLSSHTLALDAPSPIEISVDPSRIDQVLVNLISNALKYSPDGGAVRVAVRQDTDDAILTVSDEGTGITPEELATLFQPFARDDRARQSIGGTGLGLFITAEIADRHGGSILVDSDPGRGTTFTVRLPLTVDG